MKGCAAGAEKALPGAEKLNNRSSQYAQHRFGNTSPGAETHPDCPWTAGLAS